MGVGERLGVSVMGGRKANYLRAGRKQSRKFIDNFFLPCYNLYMIRNRTKKTSKFFAFCLAVGVIFSAIFSAAFSLKENGIFLASADDTKANDTQEKTDSLFLPDDYEEYLPLSEPSSVAVTENYTAIADGLKIYIYNRLLGSYSYYTHEEESDAKITQLQFDDSGILYFSVQTMYLYTLSPATLKATNVNIPCSSFDIHGDAIYYTVIAGTTAAIYSRKLSDLTASPTTLAEGVNDKPALSHNGETLFYTNAGIVLCRVDDNGYMRLLSSAAATLSAVQSMTFYGDYCYYTDTAKNLYACRYTSENAVSEKITENCSAVSSPYGNKIYVVSGKTIKELDAEGKSFTEYEISSSSPYDCRLSAATDTTLTGDKLIAIDAGDNTDTRIHILSTKTGKVISLHIVTANAKYIASDGKTACVATGEASGVLAVYDLTDEVNGATLSPVQEFAVGSGETIVGITCVYGAYYAATTTSFYAVLPNTDSEAASPYTFTTRETGKVNRLIASDIHGSIYVAHSDLIYTYTESEFVDDSVTKQPSDAIATLPSTEKGTPTKLLVDFDRNVYALQGVYLTKCANTAKAVNGESEEKSYALNTKKMVFSQDENTPIVSVAFGVETGALYILYNGDFIVKSYDLPLPTLATITVDNTDEILFAKESATFTVVSCPSKTLLVRFDAATLQGAEYFPYVSYARTESRISALALAETDRFMVLAVYDEKNNDYFTALAEKTLCAEISADEYLLDPPEEFLNGARGYITNDIPLYKYPYLTDLFTVTTLKRGTAITVVKRIEKLDWLYYQVEYVDEEGVSRVGYLPAAYVTDVNGATPDTNRTIIGTENNSKDLIWRLAYLILGTLVICILVDYLILRKQDK